LNSAATGAAAAAVINALRANSMNTHNANPGKTQHRNARRAYEQYQKGAKHLLVYKRGPSADEIAWVVDHRRINSCGERLGAQYASTGDEILLTMCGATPRVCCLAVGRRADRRTGRFIDVAMRAESSLEDLDRNAVSSHALVPSAMCRRRRGTSIRLLRSVHVRMCSLPRKLFIAPADQPHAHRSQQPIDVPSYVDTWLKPRAASS